MNGGPPTARVIKRGISARPVFGTRRVVLCPCGTGLLVPEHIAAEPVECPACDSVLDVAAAWAKAPAVHLVHVVTYMRGEGDACPGTPSSARRPGGDPARPYDEREGA